jgi:hypothetical protein
MPLTYDMYPKTLEVLDLISQGYTETQACDDVGVTVTTFKKYVKSDPELAEMYEEAVYNGHDAMVDALVNIDNHKVHGQSDPKMARVISDNIKWVVGKRDVKRFGERVQVDHNVSVDLVITSALDRARQRTLALSAPDVIEGEIVPEDDAELLRQLLA